MHNTKKQTVVSLPAVAAPTLEAHSEFQRAYDHYNKALFANALLPCLITMRRDALRVYGYFKHHRFVRLADGRTVTDGIELNPMHFAGRGMDEALSTLVHEMVHLWQAHHGTPSRPAYHNKEWAAKMTEIGLQPSDTGLPGGKVTGQKMTHYILVGGAFEKATAKLLDTGFTLSWADAAIFTPMPNKSGSRVKYLCPACRANAWGKAGLHLMCCDCGKIMQGDGPKAMQ